MNIREKNIPTPEDWNRVERYVLGQMPPDENQAFEREMSENENLREEVNRTQEAILAVKTGALREQLREIHEAKIESKKASGNFWLSVAAGIMILVAVAGWFLTRPSANERLFAEYSTTDPGLPVPMSASDEYDFFDAMVDYKSGEYDEAIRKWSTLAENDPENDTLLYYIGAAEFNQENFEQALEQFRKIPENSGFYDRTRWYTALIMVSRGDKEALADITPAPDSEYAERIMELKEQME